MGSLSKFLYHGTSGKIADLIEREGVIRPGATAPTSNPNYIYLTRKPFEALAFGYGRQTLIEIGQEFRKRRRRAGDRITVFETLESTLDPALFRESNNYPNEIAYEGVIPLLTASNNEDEEGYRVLECSITRRVEEFCVSVFYGGEHLERYIGVDLNTYLGLKTKVRVFCS